MFCKKNDPFSKKKGNFNFLKFLKFLKAITGRLDTPSSWTVSQNRKPGRFLRDFFFLLKKHPLKNIHFPMYLERPIFGSGALGARKISKNVENDIFSCFEKILVPEKIPLDVYRASPNSLGFSDSYQDQPPMTSVNKFLASKIRERFLFSLKNVLTMIKYARLPIRSPLLSLG